MAFVVQRKPDIKASNGVIHAVDMVMIPKDLVDAAKSNDDLTMLFKLIKAAGLEDTLRSDSYTIFAPSNDAFAKLSEGTIDIWMKPENITEFQQVLQRHIVRGILRSKGIADMRQAESLMGDSLGIEVNEDGSVRVNDAQIIGADMGALNGVIHVIDRLILPAK